MAAAFRRTRSGAGGRAMVQNRSSGRPRRSRSGGAGGRRQSSRAAVNRRSLWRGAARVSRERRSKRRRSPLPLETGPVKRRERSPEQARDEPPAQRRRLRSTSRGAGGGRSENVLQPRRDAPALSTPREDRHPSSSSKARGRSPQARSRSASPEPPASDTRPRVLFLMGLPGAGKTTVKRRLRRLRGRRDVEDIEPDKLKRRHPRYSDDMGDQTDDEVHRWSVRRAVDNFEDALSSRRRPFVVLDSSGSNVDWMRHRIDFARHRGYRTELLWVDVPTEIAMLRNRDRAARTGREMVPDEVIMNKGKVMAESFEKLRKEVDLAERRRNWTDDGKEMEVARNDMYFYPPPRTRPPGLRPGERGYAQAPDGARSPSPTRGSRRKIVIGPWKRGDDVMAEKNKRLEWMDRTYRGDREKFVYETVLCGRDTVLEPNRYPYQLPPDLEHWIIWSRRDFNHKDLCEYIEGWLDAREPHNVMSWNYDDNRGRRTIDIWHVHIYFQGRNGEGPWISRRRAGADSKASRPAQSASRQRMSPCSV